MSEHRSTLSQDDYVRAAMELADEAGIDSLTMRALGERLGVDATAIYRHFPNKERLIDAILDRVLAQSATLPEDPGAPVRERVKAVALSVRASFQTHPHLAAAFANATGDFPSGLTLTTRLIGYLRDMGLHGENLVRCYQMFEGYILGANVFDSGGSPNTFVIRQARYRMFNLTDFDEVARSADEVERVTHAAYEQALDLFLDHCERLAATSTS